MFQVSDNLLPIAGLGLACLALALQAFRSRREQKRRLRAAAAAAQRRAGEQGDGVGGCGAWQGSYHDPLRWACLPGVPKTASWEPQVLESELCSVKVVAMHRPTHEPWREGAGEYPYSWHLAGRKRLWEIRLQLRFKRAPQVRTFFGLTLGGYVPISGFAARVQRSLVRAIRSVVGDVYHSPGDDPARTQGEAEPPTFVMPLWAFDQFVVSEPGEEPDLTGDLEGVGMRRTDGLGAYVRAMRSTVDNLSTEKVYTFCFWGISQFLDCMNWEICGFIPGVRLDFNKFCGAAPVYVGMYEMPSVGDHDDDQRHLLSRRRYYFNIAMWSQRRPPSPEVLQSLLGTESREAAKPKSPAGKSELAKLMGCCGVRSGDVDDALLGG